MPHRLSSSSPLGERVAKRSGGRVRGLRARLVLSSDLLRHINHNTPAHLPGNNIFRQLR